MSSPRTDITSQVPIPHAGPNIVEVEACRFEDELTPVNNRAVVSIDGVRDKLRVLLVSGEPHAGERTWRNLLKSDASVDLVHFTILRPPEKQDGTPINELSLIAFPTRELFQQKINEFQLIIFDRYARQGVLPIIYFDNIARYVREGGAVLIAAGPDYASPDQHLAHAARRRPAGGAERATITERSFHARLTGCRQAPSGDARPRWLRRPIRRTGAAGSALVNTKRSHRHQRDAGPGRQAAAGAVARRRRPRRAAAVRSHLAVGARL